jgi:hypothetical protein
MFSASQYLELKNNKIESTRWENEEYLRRLRPEGQRGKRQWPTT